MFRLLEEIRKCEHCAAQLPMGCNPVLSAASDSRIIIIGQAPGIRVHQNGIPWDDASGENLRAWLGVQPDQFYDPALFALMPMGFCYPGKGRSGDLPPRPECAPLWHDRLLAGMQGKRLMILIGQYAQRYYLSDDRTAGLTQTVRQFRQYLPGHFPLPHPSPRNNIWLKKNQWFRSEVIPALQEEVWSIIN